MYAAKLDEPVADKTTIPASIRLLLWAPNGAGLHYSGPGMSAYRLLSKLTPADRVQVTLAHGSLDQKAYSLFTEQALIAPVTGSILSQASFIWQGSRWLARHRDQFDIFYGLQAFEFTIGPAMKAIDLGIPAIVKVVQNNADLAVRTDWRALLGRAKHRREKASHLSGIIAISEAIATELLSYGISERKIARIPNGVDTDYFHPATNMAVRGELRRHLGWVDEATVLFVGAIVPRKRPHLLIQAVGLLKSQGLTVQLVLAGPVKDAAYGKMMHAMADALGISHQLIWPGFVEDTRRQYQAADIFALTSGNEGMPNSLLEAMASGLPSIVTPIAGTNDLVSDGVEALYVAPEAASIADALTQYIRSTRLRQQHGAAAYLRAQSNFSARHVLERHLRLYSRVLYGQDAAEN